MTFFDKVIRARRATMVLMVGLGLALAAGMSGCATGPGAKATNAAADVLLPPQQEEQLGQEMRPQVLSEMQELQNPQIQRYIDQLGARVVRAAGGKPAGIDYTFTVIQGDEINAFTMPGGDIYVYTGLLKAADNEAELVSVLAHEVAHVTERHIAEKLVASYGLQALTNAALGDNPGMVAQLATSIASQGYLLKYSRSQESQADRTGLAYLVRAGYNPQGFVSFFQKLENQGGARPPEFLSSHPSPSNRISQARQIIGRMRNPPQELGRARYQQMIQGLK